ncbi:hypothetical protein [Arenimonas daejeonensis]|nr:hypothetical protein [Arenimonas daejeonensis]
MQVRLWQHRGGLDLGEGHVCRLLALFRIQGEHGLAHCAGLFR